MQTAERPDVATQFSDQFHGLRARRAKVTQLRVAQDLGVSTNTVSGWDTGKQVPPLVVMERIADYFRVLLDDPDVEFRFNISERPTRRSA